MVFRRGMEMYQFRFRQNRMRDYLTVLTHRSHTLRLVSDHLHARRAIVKYVSSMIAADVYETYFFYEKGYRRISVNDILVHPIKNLFSEYAYDRVSLLKDPFVVTYEEAELGTITYESILAKHHQGDQRHYFHMVTTSGWPLFVSIMTAAMLMTAVLYMHGLSSFISVLTLIIFLVVVMLLWIRDVIRESTYEGMHTSIVRNNIRQGFILFIVTEIMFFFGFFWAFFHSSLAPTVELGSIWPPIGISAINPFILPYLNTLLLLQSGVYITICHFYLQQGDSEQTNKYFGLTLLMGSIFTLIQGYEYQAAAFTIADSVYGSCFYLLTGFHGLHVIIGSILISVCWWRFHAGHFSKNRHVGFELAAWYWHFVDVVWLGLFISVYVWGTI